MPKPVPTSIVMHTDICADVVIYTVWVGDPSAGDFGDAREVWRKEVPIRNVGPFGRAFRLAAREQERVATEHAAQVALLEVGR